MRADALDRAAWFTRAGLECGGRETVGTHPVCFHEAGNLRKWTKIIILGANESGFPRKKRVGVLFISSSQAREETDADFHRQSAPTIAITS